MPLCVPAAKHSVGRRKSLRRIHSLAMPRPVTLFTGQWADLPLTELAPLAKKMGYDGVELACWGDHFDVDAAASSKST